MALYINGKQISGGGGGGNTNSVELTYAEYQALTPEQQLDGTEYFITDINGDGQDFQPIIYSDEEREIGVWKDGKPLYQITVVGGAVSTNTTDSTDLSTLNIDTFCGVVSSGSYAARASSTDIYAVGAHVMSDPKYGWGVTYDTNGGTLGVRTGSFALTSYVITIQYTKTTDTAGSGTWTPQGVPAHHYSNDEQVVGTWVDGSTLYEKTLYFNNKKATLSNSTCELVHGITNIGTVKFVESAYVDFDGGTDWATAMNTISANGNNYNFEWVVGSDAIYLKSGTNGLEFSASENRSYLFTIQYTKSST